MPPSDFHPIVEPFTEPKSSRLRHYLLILLSVITGVILFVAMIYAYFYYATNRLPDNFPTQVTFVIEEGVSAKTVVSNLAVQGFVDSELLLFLELILNHDPNTIKAGTYIFDEPLAITAIATQITQGDFSANLIRFTHFEGERVELIAEAAEVTFSDFDSTEFLALALPEEGKLFPDTYFVPKDYSARELYTLLRTTFDTRVLEIITTSKPNALSSDEIIILASIIEREANSSSSMKMVSGILQNRLDIGMALQVDASMEYVLEKPLKELTPTDLELDTPYNTYRYPGLPPTPIGNPGLDAITAVLNPTPSSYLFYITGTDGEFYYAENFDQHRANIARYLR